MLAANVDAIVNPVNTVGVMGSGLAPAFKNAFPENYVAYRRACDEGAVVPGSMFIVDCAPRTPRWIINFPIKRHWRDPSRLDDIRAGMADLVAQIRQRGISSVAVPVLREGLGGLDWGELRPLILETCGAVPDVRVLLFSPS